MMKKLFALLLALMLAAFSLAALAEEENEDIMTIAVLEGFVLDVTDETIFFQTTDGMLVEALLSEETEFEGESPRVGDFIRVVYNGLLTRSIPAQLTADRVVCHKLTGTVSDLAEESFLLTTDSGMEYVVHATEAQLTGIQNDMHVTVYFSGAATFSLPPQITASHVRGEEMLGTITEMVEGGFLMDVADAPLPYVVLLKEDALLFVQPEAGLTVRVVSDGMVMATMESIGVNALEVLPSETIPLEDISGVVTEVTDEYLVFETADGVQVQANVYEDTLWEGKEAAVGDFIHVLYNGQMTYSLPGQITALKVSCYVYTGEIAALDEEGFELRAENDVYIVNAPAELLEGLENGQQVSVYFNGVMALSLPAQIGAEMIRPVE